jgi:tripartite-type tricarboxylate transporter receptor subunit TctC
VKRGQNDVQARPIGARLSEALGQPIVCDNRPGAGGRIGFELLAQTPPDGYTIASGSIYESNSWQGIVTRAGTPGQIIARLHSEAVKVLNLPDVRNPIAAQGNDIVASSPEEFTAYIRSEMDKWGKVIKAAGVSGE